MRKSAIVRRVYLVKENKLFGMEEAIAFVQEQFQRPVEKQFDAIIIPEDILIDDAYDFLLANGIQVQAV